MENKMELTDDLRRCVDFHGHLCPGLVYGYLVAREAARLLELRHASDEEVVAISENDSCAVDALQVVLGTSAGKGNLILNNFGKNVYTVIKRNADRAMRFSRKSQYRYEGEEAEAYEELGHKIADKTATPEEQNRYKLMRCRDLLKKNFADIYVTEEIVPPKQPYAQLAPSVPCSDCGEMTMATRLVGGGEQGSFCIPCARKRGLVLA